MIELTTGIAIVLGCFFVAMVMFISLSIATAHFIEWVSRK